MLRVNDLLQGKLAPITEKYPFERLTFYRTLELRHCFALHNSQVIYTSLDLAREVQRITVDASANVSEVSTCVSFLPQSRPRSTGIIPYFKDGM